MKYWKKRLIASVSFKEVWKFDKRVKPGTKVLTGYWGWRIVEEVDDTRKWVKLVGLVAHFRRSDILKFTNK